MIASLRAQLAQFVRAINPQALSLAEGVRAALSVAVIIALHEYLQWASLSEAALAALLTCMCDPGGPIRRRVPVLLAFTIIGACITAGGGLVRGYGTPVALSFGLVGVFLTMFARIYGQAAQQVGGLLSTVLVLSLDRASPDLAYSLQLGAAFAGGSLWAVLLTLMIWPIYPFLPARRAISNVYRALAAATAELRSLALAGTPNEVAWTTHAQVHWNAVRTAIEAAREAVVAAVRARGTSSDRGRQSLIRLEASDQLFGGLIAFADEIERANASQRAVAIRLLRRLRPLLLVLADAITNDTSKANAQMQRSLAAMAADAATLPDADVVRAIAEQIIERLNIAYTLTVPANFLPGGGLDGTLPSRRERLLQPLQANRSFHSPALRHALRATAAAAPALAFTMLWFTPYDHWLTITIIMTMQPYFGVTFTRAVERTAGTVTGGLLAAAIGLICTTPISIAIAMFPLSVAALAVRAVSYSLFIAGLTPLIVLLVDIGQPGMSEWAIAGLRALFTVIGGAVAVAGCFLLWPSWEPQRLVQELRTAIAAQGRYTAAVLSHILGDAPVPTVEKARRDAGVASNNLEASISRASMEPSTGGRADLEAAMVVDAALRRCAGRATAIMLDPTIPAALPLSAWRAWRDWVTRSSSGLATGNLHLDARPSPGIEAVARIGRQLELIAGTLARMQG